MTYFRAIRTIMGPKCLTAVFGMGTGVATWVWSPESRLHFRLSISDCRLIENAVIANGRRIRVAISARIQSRQCREGMLTVWLIASNESLATNHYSWEARINAVKRLAVSTGQLKALLLVHRRPIDPVVFREPTHIKCWRPDLAEGFTLICLQRLSWPHVGYPAVPRAG